MSNKLASSLAKMAAFMVVCLYFMIFHSSSATAQVVISRPVPHAVSSDFGRRDGRGHNGTDYASPLGTMPVVTPGYIGSPNYRPLDGNAAGRRVHFNYACGVQVSYFHLDSYSAGPPPVLRTGSSGASGDGSYSPHLHFEIRINSQPVDPEAALGLDLCDPRISACLVADGRQRLSGAIARGADQGVCGGGGTPYSGPPPLTPPPDTGAPPDDEDTSPARPPMTPPSYTPPTLSGGPENNVGPPAGGPVLWDSTEYAEGALTTNACDVEVYVVMRGRAAMEAQEDIVASEITIHRPDSVLEYTCADEWMGFTAERAGPLFSETNTWVGRTFPLSITGSVSISVHLDPTSLDQVLEDTVVSSIYEYVRQQFPLEFLSNTSGGLDGEVSNTIGGASYTCTKMSEVWQIAKCENFGDSGFYTGPGPFYTFNEMIPNTNDPRTQYNACNDTGLYPLDLQVMSNEDFLHHGFSPATIPGINMHDYVSPASCTGLGPIPTGIHVMRVIDADRPSENVIEYEEHFCANPGCYYDYTAGTCTR